MALYTTWGSARGGCGHVHGSHEEAQRCAQNDRNKCAGGPGGNSYSDRHVREIAEAGDATSYDITRGPGRLPRPDESDEIGIVETNDIPCNCGQITGSPCPWRGPRDETVLIEFMPRHLRNSHTEARARGTYPANGAIRVRVEESCAKAIVDAEEGWAEIV